VRPRPDRVERLPEQYFARLLARVAAAAAEEGDEVVDLGRGNPDIGPPQHVIDALSRAANDRSAHGYPPFRGIPELKEAVAARYRDVYGVKVDAEREVAVVPGTKTAIVEVAMCLAERGDTILLPDPGYPDYTSGVALSGAREGRVPLDPSAAFAPDLGAAPREGVAALYLNYPSNPCSASAPPGAFAAAVRWAEETGAAVLHDFAYADLVFDGLRPASFLAEPGAKEVGAELFSMSKSYGMAGWRLGFVVGHAELVERVNLLQDHVRAGVFRPVQEAGVAALRGPRGAARDLRAAPRPGGRRAPGHALGLDVLRLVAPAGGPDAGADPGGDEGGGRAGRGLRPERRGVGADLPRHAGRPPDGRPRAPQSPRGALSSSERVRYSMAMTLSLGRPAASFIATKSTPAPAKCDESRIGVEGFVRLGHSAGAPSSRAITRPAGRCALRARARG
jgi:aminotransferase